MATMPWRITLILIANVTNLDTNNKVVTNTFIDMDNFKKNHYMNKKDKTCSLYPNTHDHNFKTWKN
jgi:hypothetical protein